MKSNSMRVLAAALAILVQTGVSHAALHDRGGGLIYDDVLDVTWLQDANYALTSGHHETGRMNWHDASAWAASAVYHDSVRGVSYEDWRLPDVSPQNGEKFQTWAVGSANRYNGGLDIGYNIKSAASELAYMFYVNLGLTGWADENGRYPQPDFGVPEDGLATSAEGIEFQNIARTFFWYSETNYNNTAWTFNTRSGEQNNAQGMIHANPGGFVWLVRDGDVAPIPEPHTYAMLLAGLGVIGAALRRRKQD